MHATETTTTTAAALVEGDRIVDHFGFVSVVAMVLPVLGGGVAVVTDIDADVSIQHLDADRAVTIEVRS